MADGSSSRCCACNGRRAVCKSCSCVKKDLPCSSCLPGKQGSCHNPASHLSRVTDRRHVVLLGLLPLHQPAQAWAPQPRPLLTFLHIIIKYTANSYHA